MTVTWRDASDFSVGGSGGVRLNGLEQAPSSNTALMAVARTTARLVRGRTATLPCEAGAVDDLCHCKARLRPVSRQTLLLPQEFRHGELLDCSLLLLRERRDARNHRIDAR